jgi:hypothetical protein
MTMYRERVMHTLHDAERLDDRLRVLNVDDESIVTHPR